MFHLRKHKQSRHCSTAHLSHSNKIFTYHMTYIQMWQHSSTQKSRNNAHRHNKTDLYCPRLHLVLSDCKEVHQAQSQVSIQNDLLQCTVTYQTKQVHITASSHYSLNAVQFISHSCKFGRRQHQYTLCPKKCPPFVFPITLSKINRF